MMVDGETIGMCERYADNSFTPTTRFTKKSVDIIYSLNCGDGFSFKRWENGNPKGPGGYYYHMEPEPLTNSDIQTYIETGNVVLRYSHLHKSYGAREGIMLSSHYLRKSHLDGADRGHQFYVKFSDLDIRSRDIVRRWIDRQIQSPIIVKIRRWFNELIYG